MNKYQSQSIIYYNELTRKRQITQTVVFGGALAICLPFVLLLWFDNYTNMVDASELRFQRMFITFFLTVLIIPLIQARNHIPVVRVLDDGLELRGLLLRSTIPWSEVIDIWKYDTPLRLRREQDHYSCLIRIRSGLSIFHRSLPRKENDRWHWYKGFVIASSGEGYSEIIAEIIKRVGDVKDLRFYYKVD